MPLPCTNNSNALQNGGCKHTWSSTQYVRDVSQQRPAVRLVCSRNFHHFMLKNNISSANKMCRIRWLHLGLFYNPIFVLLKVLCTTSPVLWLLFILMFLEKCPGCCFLWRTVCLAVWSEQVRWVFLIAFYLVPKIVNNEHAGVILW